MSTLNALNSYVLIKLAEVAPISEGGLYLPPSSASQGPSEGIVVNAGTSCKSTLPSGTKVVFDRRGALEQKVDSELVLIVPEANVLAFWS
jgi:co-chaperonin GroES (HSP10)